MRTLIGVSFSLYFALAAFGQAGNGTITGTVSDPAGAVVANAAVEIKNVETGLVYSAVTTNTGNYTVAQLPPGVYELTIRVAGFKTYVHSKLEVLAAQILREDPQLQVGTSTESVLVEAEASLLATDSSELSHVVTLRELDDL